jgi:hypothetical protein
VRTIIAGSRTIDDYAMVSAAIACSFFPITEVVCGMAKGVDLLGKQWAEERGIPVIEFPADWEKHGKQAGYLRNIEMAENADALIAITSGSPGTKHMIKEAHLKGLKVFVYSVL